MKPAKKLPLTKECHHWRRLGEVPWDLQKYWQQRHTIFSNYNEGVYMTHDAWFGVTPEPVAIQIANDVDGVFPDLSKSTIVDLFAGVGNNAISFALQPHPEADEAGGDRRRWDRVIAVERDPATLACAQHNAALHGLGPESIVWVLGDSFEFLEGAVASASHRRRRPGDGKTTATKRQKKKKASSSRKGKRRPETSADASEDNDEDEDDEDNVMGAGDDDADDVTLDPATTVLFASPPWGGPGYSTDAIFDLSTMEPYALARLHAAYRAMDHALYLPRTSDLRQIARLAPAQPAHPGKAEEQEEGGSSSSTKEKKKKKKIEVVQYCVEGASKALVAYIPAVTTTREEEEQERQGQQRDGDSGLERAMELD